MHTEAVRRVAATLGSQRRVWRPTKDRILVERLDMGRERTTKGGIVLPATLGAKAKTKADMWRGKVLAVGPDVRELTPGDHVLVHTWAEGDGSTLYTGVGLGAHRVLIRPDDVICAVDPDAEIG